jgi:SAM-dependent methyltransferase
VFIHFVLQHVREPAPVVAEAFRVLRPNGVVGIADADFAGSIIGPPVPDLDHALEMLIRLRADRGGSPFVGRELGGLLHGAGFVETTPGARAEVEAGTEVVARTGESQAMYFGAPELRAYAIARGLATAAELEIATRAWKVWGTTAGAFWARFTCFATGRKP